ncbi:hypothetical protein, partial [Rhizobium hidalgonense]
TSLYHNLIRMWAEV